MLARAQLLLLLPALAAAAAAPNVMFIVSDDLGFDDVGFRMKLNGQAKQIATPNIDAFATNGVILNQYYVQCVCSPSRTTFLSGRYPEHHGINDWIPPASSYGLPLNETTMADLFSKLGYDTHAVGKWHAGFFQDGYTPTFRGFDSFYGFYSGGEDYFTHQAGSGAYDFRDDPKPKCAKGCSQVASNADHKYSTVLFSERAVQIVQTKLTPAKPFFFYLAYQAVHAPEEVPAFFHAKYGSQIKDRKRSIFAGMLGCMDNGIGNVTAALKAKGLLDNTLIVFTADNGGPTTTGDSVGSRNWPLKGGKHSIWEGGTRATAVVADFGGTFLKQRGVVSENLHHAADWLPTLVAGFAKGSTKGCLPLDGVDSWKWISDATPTAAGSRTEIFYGSPDEQKNCVGTRIGGLCWDHNAVRQGKWKLIANGGGIPDTWFAPVNASRAADPICAPPDLVWLRGYDAPPTCTPYDKQCFPSNDLKHVATKTAADCCAAASKEEGAQGFTWQPPGAAVECGNPKLGCCFIKHTLAGSEKCSGSSGGTPGAPAPKPGPPHPPHPPPPSPLKPHYFLFDLSKDPGEHTDVSAANPDVVTKLKARIAFYLKSRVPTATNSPIAACTTPTFANDSKVGKSWQPWC